MSRAEKTCAGSQGSVDASGFVRHPRIRGRLQWSAGARVAGFARTEIARPMDRPPRRTESVCDRRNRRLQNIRTRSPISAAGRATSWRAFSQTWMHISRAVQGRTVRSFISRPLVHAGERLGVLNLHSSCPNILGPALERREIFQVLGDSSVARVGPCSCHLPAVAWNPPRASTRCSKMRDAMAKTLQQVLEELDSSTSAPRTIRVPAGSTQGDHFTFPRPEKQPSPAPAGAPTGRRIDI